MRIFFMGGHNLGSLALESLIYNEKNVVGVAVTDTSNSWYKGVDEVALKYNVPLFREKNINNDDFIQKVRQLRPDLIVVVNFEQILKKEIINMPTKGCINTHASLLPKYRGRAPLNWAIINGEDETGITVHYIEEGIDTGDIVVQEKFKIDKTDYIEDIMQKVEKVYSKIVLLSVEMIEDNNVHAIKQDLTKGFYCKKRNPNDGQINWDMSVKDIYNLIRAVSKPYPGAFTFYNDEKIVIWKAHIEEHVSYESKAGKIINIIDGDILIKAADGVIRITDYDFNIKRLNIGSEFSYKGEL